MAAQINAEQSEEGPQGHVQQQLHKKSEVADADAVIDPWTVVVHAQHALSARLAVVGSLDLEIVALPTDLLTLASVVATVQRLQDRHVVLIKLLGFQFGPAGPI